MNNNKIELYGFNNLTKSLSFNIYDVCYADTPKEQEEYIRYINKQYNSERLITILYQVTELIGAHVLSVSKQDYEPQGASVTFLISSGEDDSKKDLSLEEIMSETVVAHLDKSHVTVHTYPEYHPHHSISTFRVDIDVSTCGEITPLKTLNYLIHSFDSDIITIDYRVRGFTRDLNGKKHFLDHSIYSIQDFIDEEILSQYQASDINIEQYNLFHTKMMINTIVLQNYLFNIDANSLPQEKQDKIKDLLYKEMSEIFSGQNIYQY